MRTKLVISTTAIVAVAGVVFIASRGRAQGPIAAEPSDELVAPAIVEAHGDRIELAFERTGRIAAILVDEGDRVQAGQVLARLDDRMARARVAGALAAVEAAKARRDLAARGPRRDEIRAAAADAEAAGAQAWERNLGRDRAERLLAAEAVAEAEVNSARGAARATAAQARAATARYAVVKQGTRRELVAEADAMLALAEAQLEEARVDLAHTELRSPIDAVVLRRSSEVGEQATQMPLTTVLVIADIDHLELRAEIDEADVARVQLGQSGWATADAYGDRRFPVRLVRITGELGRKTQRLDDPLARVDTRVLEVVLALDEPAPLPLGLRMDVQFEAL